MDQITEKIIVPAHSIIFRQGDPGENYFIILSGNVRIFTREKSGRETDLSLLGSGDGFGEMALLSDEKQSASVEALEETQLLVIGKTGVDSVIKNNPDVSRAFIKEMSTCLLRDDLPIDRTGVRQSEAPKFSWLDCLFIVFISIFCGIIFNFSSQNRINLIPEFWHDEKILRVTPQTALAKHWEDSLFVDARPNLFFKRGHIKGAVNMPSALFDMMYTIELGGLNKNKRIIVYGRTISSRYDEQVARKFVVRGHDNIMILRGGLSAWKKKGYPVL